MASLSMFRRLRRSENGAELVEFGLMFREYEIITNAAREGARVRILPAYANADAEARVDQYLNATGLTLARRTRTVDAPVLTNVGGKCISTIAVNVTYSHPVPFLRGVMQYFGSTFGDVTLRASSAMRTEVAAGTCP